jgi:predicted TIM-barrel fold metal-dependent hydrolase
MTYPTDPQAVDLMIGFPFKDKNATYEYLRKGYKDSESLEGGKLVMPAEYMFKDAPPQADEGEDPIATTFAKMDTCGVRAGLFGLSDTSIEAKRRYPDRVFLSKEIDLDNIMTTVRQIRGWQAEHDLKAVTTFPAGLVPQVAVSDPQFYPIYAVCVELDIPIIVNAGIPGPRVPADCQHVRHFDQVCYDFPELKIVMRHGAEPWEALAVKLMLKWPGLHYMTSGFAPKYYPDAIIKYANSRGSDKVMYAGYYPAGLDLERIFRELPDLPIKEHVWPKFLHENAERLFKL